MLEVKSKIIQITVVINFGNFKGAQRPFLAPAAPVMFFFDILKR